MDFLLLKILLVLTLLTFTHEINPCQLGHRLDTSPDVEFYDQSDIILGKMGCQENILVISQ